MAFMGDLGEECLFLYDFDKIKVFENYFCHNNYLNVCKEKKIRYNRKNIFAKKNLTNSIKTL